MIGHFIGVHPFWGYAGMGMFLALSGYGFSRLDPKSPLLALGSWFMSLMYFAFALAGLRILSPLGPIAALVALIVGLVWMARYYQKHRPD